MPTSQYLQEIKKLAGQSVLVVGDMYLDEYVWGDMAEISKEGPYPVIHIHHRVYHPGAAGSVAAQVQTFGSQAYVVGTISNDINGTILRKQFHSFGAKTQGLVIDKEHPTNTYTKIRAGNYPLPSQELYRLDTPPPAPISNSIERKIIESLRAAPKVRGIIVIDQVGSVVTPRILEAVISLAKKKNLFVAADSRIKLGIFEGCDLVVPNEQEARTVSGLSSEQDPTLLKTMEFFLQSRQHKTTVITRSSHGMIALQKNGESAHMLTTSRKVVDVTAAGDTVTVALTLGLMAGLPLQNAVSIASYAAGIAVEQVGTYSVTTEDLRARLENEIIGKTGKKIVSPSELTKITREHQTRGEKVVWTNGCFDIIHLGHIFYLEQAKKEGEILAVGLNSDESVRAIKGPERPIISENERARVLSALECVDYITIFNDPSPLNLLKKLKPDKYVKGGDYTIDTINQEERHLLERYGIEIVLMPKIEGASTTKVISKIRNK